MAPSKYSFLEGKGNNGDLTHEIKQFYQKHSHLYAKDKNEPKDLEMLSD